MFYDQYGDNAGIDQGQIEKQGKAYLDKSFPKLDTIKSAVITDPAPTAAPCRGQAEGGCHDRRLSRPQPPRSPSRVGDARPCNGEGPEHLNEFLIEHWFFDGKG